MLPAAYAAVGSCATCGTLDGYNAAVSYMDKALPA